MKEESDDAFLIKNQLANPQVNLWDFEVELADKAPWITFLMGNQGLIAEELI